MMDRSVMVEVKNLKKRYRLGEIGTESFRQDLQSWWARHQGKDDPLSRIGEEPDVFYALKGLSLTFRRGESDRKSTRLNSSHPTTSRMPSSA